MGPLGMGPLGNRLLKVFGLAGRASTSTGKQGRGGQNSRDEYFFAERCFHEDLHVPMSSILSSVTKACDFNEFWFLQI